MSLPMLHSPGEVLQQLLVNLGLGTDPDDEPIGAWPVYEDKEPSSPDEVLTTYDTTPKSSGRSMIDGEQWLHYGLMVRVRGNSKARAYKKAESVRVTLNEHVVSAVVTLADDGGIPRQYLVPAVCNTSMLRVGQQSPATKRFVYTVNGTAAVLRVS